MPNLYARATALPNVAGRINYISSEQRQENLLAVYDGAADLLDGQFWNVLAAESQAAYDQFGQKDKKCCQGREIVLQLSNDLLERKSADEIVKIAVDHVSQGTGQPVIGALHLNASESNLHLHLIFPERSLLEEPVIKVAERNLFFDEEGKRRYKKAEILDENKELRPGCRIVKKGEIYEQRYFGAADTRFSSKSWMKDFKTNCLLALRNGDLKGDVLITEFDASTGKLPQQKVGYDKKYRDDPGAPERIREYNRMVRRYNKLIDRGDIDLQTALEIQRDIMGSRQKNEPLQAALDRLAKALQEAEAEKKKRAQEHFNWVKYQAVRDAAWQAYLGAQRVEMAEIRNCTQEMRELYEKNSTPIYGKNGEIVGRKMRSPLYLERSGYYDKMEKLKLERSEHEWKLRTIREYEDISRGRQKIMRALILAGAEQDVINSAMREYEEASRRLQVYVQNPDTHDGRRLAAAKTSLELAEKRAAHYIQKLTAEQAEQLKAPEDCAIMEQVDREYDAFHEEHEAQAKALEAEMAAAEAAAVGRKPSLADQIGGAESRSGSGSGNGSRGRNDPER